MIYPSKTTTKLDARIFLKEVCLICVHGFLSTKIIHRVLLYIIVFLDGNPVTMAMFLIQSFCVSNALQRLPVEYNANANECYMLAEYHRHMAAYPNTI